MNAPRAAGAAHGADLGALRPEDLEAVAAIDRATLGRSRRGFFEKRLRALERDPEAGIAIAARDARGLAGFMIAGLLAGEFGVPAPLALLDAFGVRVDARGRGVGHALLGALDAAARARGAAEMRTQGAWADQALLGFFHGAGFAPAPRLVLERANPADRIEEADADTDTDVTAGALARDRIPVRSLAPGDLAALVAIDRRLTGEERTGYYRRRFAESLEGTGVRVSLVAETDAHVAGFVMARVDFGEFGCIDPVAVIDTVGVDPGQARQKIGSALLSQLFANLAALRVERVRTEVAWNEFGLLGFLARRGFAPADRLVLRRTLADG